MQVHEVIYYKHLKKEEIITLWSFCMTIIQYLRIMKVVFNFNFASIIKENTLYQHFPCLKILVQFSSILFQLILDFIQDIYIYIPRDI